MAESDLHHRLKQRAVKWLIARGCFAACDEVDLSPGRGRLFDAGGFRRAGKERHILGVEVKVSRADFAKEIRHTKNARGKLASYQAHEAYQAGFPHYCYLLCPENLVQPGEIPADWGLLYWVDDKTPLQSVKRAKRNNRASADVYVPALEAMVGQLSWRARGGTTNGAD